MCKENEHNYFTADVRIERKNSGDSETTTVTKKVICSKCGDTKPDLVA